MTKRLKICAGILATAILFIFVERFVHKGVVKAKDSEFIYILKSYQDVQKSYKSTYGSYSSSEDLIGYKVTNTRLSLVSDSSVLADRYRSKIKESDLPYIDKESYQVLLIVHTDDGEEIWAAKSEGVPFKLFP